MDLGRLRVRRTPRSQDRVHAPVQLPRAFSCCPRELMWMQFAEILQTDHRQLHPHHQVIMDGASAACSRKLRATLSPSDCEFNNAALWKITPIERRIFVNPAREHRVMSVFLLKMLPHSGRSRARICRSNVLVQDKLFMTQETSPLALAGIRRRSLRSIHNRDHILKIAAAAESENRARLEW